jgi:hypothetical protein
MKQNDRFVTRKARCDGESLFAIAMKKMIVVLLPLFSITSKPIGSNSFQLVVLEMKATQNIEKLVAIQLCFFASICLPKHGFDTM